MIKIILNILDFLSRACKSKHFIMLLARTNLTKTVRV